MTPAPRWNGDSCFSCVDSVMGLSIHRVYLQVIMKTYFQQSSLTSLEVSNISVPVQVPFWSFTEI